MASRKQTKSYSPTETSTNVIIDVIFYIWYFFRLYLVGMFALLRQLLEKSAALKGEKALDYSLFFFFLPCAAYYNFCSLLSSTSPLSLVGSYSILLYLLHMASCMLPIPHTCIKLTNVLAISGVPKGATNAKIFHFCSLTV